MAANNTSLMYAEALSQNITLYSSYGDEVDVSLDYLRAQMHWGTTVPIIAAVQIGAAIATLVGMLLISKGDKRRHWVYWLNVLALVLDITNNVVAATYCISPWFDPYPLLTGAYTHITAGPKAISVFNAAVTVLLVITIETSLILQTKALCSTLSRPRRLLLLGVGAVFVTAALVLRIVYFFLNAIYDDINAEGIDFEPLIHGRDVMITVSFVFFSAIFVVKLGLSVRQRRVLGLARFGPMQVVLIGFTQPMALPAIFAMLSFVRNTDSINQLVLTSVVLSLPLTAIWATTVAEGPAPLSRPNFNRVMVVKTAEQDSTFSSATKYGTVASVSVGSGSVASRDMEMQKL